MDFLTFVSGLIRDLAWPGTTLIALMVVFKCLPILRGFVKSIRYKDFEVTLHEEFAEAREAADKLKIEDVSESYVEEYLADKIFQLAQIDPALAVIEIWRELETKLVKFIQHNGLMRFTTPARVVEHLGNMGRLTDSEVKLYRKLRNIRNASVHSHEPNVLTLGEIMEFRDFSNLLIKKLAQLQEEPGYIDIPGKSP